MAICLFPLLGREGVVVLVMRICLLRISPSRLGKGRGGGHGRTQPFVERFSSSSGNRNGDHGHRSPPSSGKGRGGGHGHTCSSSWNNMVVAMVMHNLLLRGSPPHLEKGKVIMAIGLLPLLGREGAVVMVIHLFLLRMSYCFLGKGRGGGT